MNLPNAITLVRLILVPVFVGLMVYGHFGAALAVFLVAGLTDALDGALARLLKKQTELGAFLDPLADKLLILAAFVTLVALDRIPVWLAVIVISRDGMLALGSFVLMVLGHPVRIAPSLLGKATTAVQLLLVTATLLILYDGREWGGMQILTWLTAGLTLASGGHYLLRGMKLADQGGAGRPTSHFAQEGRHESGGNDSAVAGEEGLQEPQGRLQGARHQSRTPPGDD